MQLSLCYSVIQTTLHPPVSPSTISSTHGDCGATSGFLPPSLWPGNLTYEVNWVNRRARLFCFLSLWDHFLLLPDVQYIGNHCFLYVAVFAVAGKKVYPVPVTPSRSRVEVYLYLSFELNAYLFFSLFFS